MSKVIKIQDPAVAMAKPCKFIKHVAILALATTASLTLFGCNEEHISEEEVNRLMDEWSDEDAKLIEGFTTKYNQAVDEFKENKGFGDKSEDQRQKEKFFSQELSDRCAKLDKDTDQASQGSHLESRKIQHSKGARHATNEQLKHVQTRAARAKLVRTHKNAAAIRCHAASYGMDFKIMPPEAFVEQAKLTLTKEQAMALHDAFKHSEKSVMQIPQGVRGLEDHADKPISAILVGEEETPVLFLQSDASLKAQRETVMELLHKAAEGAQPCILDTFNLETCVDAQASFLANAKFGQTSYETIIRKGEAWATDVKAHHSKEGDLGTCDGVHREQNKRFEQMSKRSGFFMHGFQDFNAMCPKCLENLQRFLDRVYKRCQENKSGGALELSFSEAVVNEHKRGRNRKHGHHHHQLEVEGHAGGGHSRATGQNNVELF